MKKLVLVTGASSGIGRASSIELAARGCQVVLVGRREDALKEAAAECGDGALYRVADVSSSADVLTLAKEVGELVDGMELVLVNAAGIAEFGDFEQMSLESIEAQIQTNLLGPAYLVHALIPLMLSAERGHVVNVLSVAAELVLPGSAAYSATKAGLRMMSKVWAAEYRRKGVRFSCILPGAVDTPIWGGGGPPRKDMIPVTAVSDVIADVVMSPPDRSYDEIHLMPPKGIL